MVHGGVIAAALLGVLITYFIVRPGKHDDSGEEWRKANNLLLRSKQTESERKCESGNSGNRFLQAVDLDPKDDVSRTLLAKARGK